MAEDFTDVNDLSGLSDDEIYEVVMEHLSDNPTLDSDNITVNVEAGRITLTGRVGTDAERQIADHILTDLLGATDFVNELVVDELRRYELPTAEDDVLIAEAEQEGGMLGIGSMDQEDTVEEVQEDYEEQALGTRDVQSAIQQGTPYVPPESPTPDGYLSGENH